MTFKCNIRIPGIHSLCSFQWKVRGHWVLGIFLFFLILQGCAQKHISLEPTHPSIKTPNQGKTQILNYINDITGTQEERKQARKKLIDAGTEAIPLLIERINDPEFKIRWEVVNVLGYIGNPSAAAAVAKQATHDKNPHVRWRGYWSLSSMSGNEPREELLKWLDDDDEWVAWNATVGLTFFREKSVLPRLIKGLDQEDPWRRWEAANAMRSVADESAIPALVKLLSDDDEKLRCEAVLGLASIPGEQTTQALLSALDDSSHQVRWRAVMSLSRRLNDKIRKRLETLRESETETLVLEQIDKALDSK